MKRRRDSSCSQRSGNRLFFFSLLLQWFGVAQLPLSAALPFIRRQVLQKSPATITKIRGGDSNEQFFTAVGVQMVGSIKTKNQDPPSSLLSDEGPNFMLLQGNTLLESASSSCKRIWDGDAAALEALSICCDVMVVVVVVDSKTESDRPLLDAALVKALERGLQHRASNGMLSSVLILLVSSSPKSSKLTSEKDRLVLRDLATLTPKMVSSLDLLSLDDPEEATEGLAKVWKDILRDMSSAPQRTTSHMVEPKVFSRFLRDVYQSKGGNRPDFLQPLVQELEEITEQKEAVDLNKVEDASVSVTKSMSEDQEESTSASAPAEDEVPAAGHESIQRDDVSNEETLLSILSKTKNQIQDLEARQEHLWLGFSTDDLSNPESMLDFGSHADRIIDQYQTEIKESIDESLQPRAKDYLWQQVLPPLKQLYDQYLQFLREQYGKQYESALEDRSSRQMSLEDQQSFWKDAAMKVTTAFRTAAQGAVPIQCQPGGSLRDANFDYVPVLEGLVSDMMKATTDHEELLGIDPDEGLAEDAAPEQSRGKRPAKWYEKVAAKAVVFAVNYFQGWLAYQGIKRAAAQRDAHLPKFPLF